MEYICKTGLFPYISSKYKNLKRRAIKQKTLHTIGIGESLLAKKIGDINSIVKKGKDYEIKLAFLPSNYEVRLRITVSAGSVQKAERLINTAVRIIKKGAGKYVYSDEESSIQETVGKLLLKKKLTIAAAESCTGGLITSKLTDVPGSSDYVMDGIVSYADRAKVKFLGVKKESIKKFGAVSKQVSIEMASGIRIRSKTDIGISATGIAGPSGARKNKPVGLVWIGYSDKTITFAKDFIFTKDRLRNKDIMAKMSLEVVRRKLLSIEQ
jgi:nicotinamide-nucleotide amidase